MIKLGLRSYIKGATPEEVFAALSDRSALKTLLPRMQEIEFGDEQYNSQDVVMHIGIGAGFGVIPCEGTLSWNEPREVVFTVRKPLPVKTQWDISPGVNGTEIDITLSLDLKPFLGHMENFVPKSTVRNMMEKEMRHAIGQIGVRVQELRQRGGLERAAAA
jgi:hypothetical protein